MNRLYFLLSIILFVGCNPKPLTTFIYKEKILYLKDKNLHINRGYFIYKGRPIKFTSTDTINIKGLINESNLTGSTTFNIDVGLKTNSKTIDKFSFSIELNEDTVVVASPLRI